MSTRSRGCKRRYRHRVKCDECHKEMNSDYQETHTQNIHHGKKIKFSPLVESAQCKLGSFFTSTVSNTISNSEPEASGASMNESEPSELREATESNALQANSVSVQWLQPERELKQSTLNQVEEENIHEAGLQNIITGASTNVNEPINVPDESADEIGVNQASILSEYPTKLLGSNAVNNSEPVAGGSSTNESEPSELREAAKSNALQANGVDVQWRQPQKELKQPNVNRVEEELMFLDENIHETAMQTSMTGTSANVNEPTGNIYMPPTASSKSLGPNQPTLSEYPTKLRGNEPYPRRFNPQLYKKYPCIDHL